MSSDLWTHQVQMLVFALKRDYAMLAAGMGTGKTRVAYEYLNWQTCNYALILTTKKGLDVWQEQYFKYSDQMGRLYVISKATPSTRIDFIKDALHHFNSILLMNYEVFWRSPVYDLLLKYPPEIIIADESHRLKSVSGKASKAAWKLGRLARKRVALTGTPFHHSPSDIFGQYRFLNDEVLGKAYYKFRQEYEVTRPVGSGIQVTVGHKNLDRLAQVLEPSMIVIKTEDVIDLPKVMHVVQKFDLSSQSSRIYKELRDDYISQVNEGVVTISNALVAALRLQQLTGGFIRADQSDKYQQIDTEKLSVLTELIDNLGPDERYVIFARFTAEIQAIKKHIHKTFGYWPREISGNWNEYKIWKAEPEQRAIIVQIQSGSESIDLTEARYAFYYSLPNSLGQFEQSKARLVRPGADINQPVFFYYLLANNTVDQVIYKALQSRKEVNQALIEDIQNDVS